MKTAEFTTALGPKKGAPRARVRIRGKQLACVGFKPGARFRRRLYEGAIILELVGMAFQGEAFTVSNEGAKPSVEVAGRPVTDRFKGTHVRVVLMPGMIEIQNCEGAR